MLTGRVEVWGRTKQALQIGVILFGSARYTSQPAGHAAAWLDLAWSTCLFLIALTGAGFWHRRELETTPRSGVVWARFRTSNVLQLVASASLMFGLLRVYDLADRPSGVPCGDNIGVCVALKNGTTRIFPSDPGGPQTLDMCRKLEFRGCLGNERLYILVWVSSSIISLFSFVKGLSRSRQPQTW
jgi:hypothetical protein